MRKLVGLQDEELRQSLLTSYTGEYFTQNPPTVEQIRSKRHDYMTLRRVNRKRNHEGTNNQATKQQTPSNWTTPNASHNQVNQSKPSATYSSPQQPIQSNIATGQQGQGQVNYKAPIDRSTWKCYACGELGHTASRCPGYRKSLCKMGYGPPPGVNDPDALDKHYAAVVKLAPLHCFHCMEQGFHS